MALHLVGAGYMDRIGSGLSFINSSSLSLFFSPSYFPFQSFELLPGVKTKRLKTRQAGSKLFDWLPGILGIDFFSDSIIVVVV